VSSVPLQVRHAGDERLPPWQEVSCPDGLALSRREVAAGDEPLLLLAHCERQRGIGGHARLSSGAALLSASVAATALLRGCFVNPWSVRRV
jgi:hypothetical protein